MTGANCLCCAGEGKTLVAVLPSYLNALAGKGVHVVTVNDYLARRDSEWVGQVPRFLGMQVRHGTTRSGGKGACSGSRGHARHVDRGVERACRGLWCKSGAAG